MTPSEVEVVAGKLTKAQRDAITGAYSAWSDRWKAIAGWRTTNKLFHVGLTDEDEYLTPLGLAIKAHLERQR